MIYVFRSAPSEGAQLLAEDICLLGHRARRTQGGLLARLQAGDKVICWGDNVDPIANVQYLNNVPAISKFAEAEKLAAAGVPTVQVNRMRPAPQRRMPFQNNTYNLAAAPRYAARLDVAAARELADSLHAWAREENDRRIAYEALPVVVDEWLPRRNNHMGGTDLLGPPARPDYYSKKENIVEEYRLHIFRGKSIRAGRKVPRDNAHDWIRSFDAGWIIAYEGFRSTEAQRAIAVSAVKALDLDFGAVDLGLCADGRLIVLEVNRAPGVEGGTAKTYAEKIVQWATNQRG